MGTLFCFLGRPAVSQGVPKLLLFTLGPSPLGPEKLLGPDNNVNIGGGGGGGGAH